MVVESLPKINVLNRNLKEIRFLHYAWMKDTSHSSKKVGQKHGGQEKWMCKENQEIHFKTLQKKE